MYDPQLEKLIAIALKDGIVTDKERQILIKKAIEFGVDVDEFEMELDSRIPTKNADKPLMNIGNDNIVKANIKGSGNGGSGSGMPLMNIGNDNVIKAEIDASTNITHDNSVKVKGTFVAQQTVINETAGSAFIKSISSFMERGPGSKKQIEEQLDKLPNDTAVLLKTLSQLCRFIFRELNKFYSGKERVIEHMQKHRGTFSLKVDDPIKNQIDYAKKILDKLHEVAFDNKDEILKATITKLDEIVFTSPKIYLFIAMKEQYLTFISFLWAPIAIFCLVAVSCGISFLLSFNFGLLITAILFAGATYGALKLKNYLNNNQISMLKINKIQLQEDDKYLQNLIESIKTV